MIRVLRGLRVYLATMNTLHHHSYYSERKIGPASPRGSQEWVKNMGSRMTSRWREGRGEMEASFQGWDKGLTWMLKDNQGADGSPGNLWPHNDAWWRWKLCSLDPSPALPFTLSIHLSDLQLSSVQLLSHVRLFAAPRTAAHQASLSITNSRSLLKLMPIESVMPSNHLILCHPLLLPTPSVIPSIRVFLNESVLHIRWPKYWRFSFGISPSIEYSGLISFRMD